MSDPLLLDVLGDKLFDGRFQFIYDLSCQLMISDKAVRLQIEKLDCLTNFLIIFVESDPYGKSFQVIQLTPLCGLQLLQLLLKRALGLLEVLEVLMIQATHSTEVIRASHLDGLLGGLEQLVDSFELLVVLDLCLVFVGLEFLQLCIALLLHRR